MNILLTICARKGSKRLPNKAIKEFCGRPLYEWTLLNALDFKNYIYNSHKVDIIVCTDIDDIQTIYNINRPKELSCDNIPKLDIIRYAYKQAQIRYMKKFDCVIDLDITAPLRFIDDIEDALKHYIKFNCQSTLFSVVQSRRNPGFNQIKQSQKNLSVDYALGYRWDSGSRYFYDLNASIYIYNSGWLDKSKYFYSKTPICNDSLIYIMQDWQFIDIDTQLDFDIAEFLFKKYILSKNE